VDRAAKDIGGGRRGMPPKISPYGCPVRGRCVPCLEPVPYLTVVPDLCKTLEEESIAKFTVFTAQISVEPLRIYSSATDGVVGLLNQRLCTFEIFEASQRNLYIARAVVSNICHVSSETRFKSDFLWI
jgi:hypothetical protein